MKYLETKHERNSAKITTLIVVILLLLLFVVGPPYMDPPLEYGVAVNFGNSEMGSGEIQPTEPVKSEIKDIKTELTKVEEIKKETNTNSKAEDILTEESPESIAIKKAKEAELKAKLEADRKLQQQREAEERRRKEEQDKKEKLDALIGGVSNSEGTQSGGEGPDKTGGDKGQLDGDPYAPSYFGGSGPGKGGVGYGLNGRGSASFKTYEQQCNEYGLVVVKIEVNRQGNVVNAEPGVKGTTNTDPCLLEPAKKIALSHKWPSDSKAPERQVGFVSINFNIGQ